MSLEINLLTFALLIIFIIKLSSGRLLYLFQNSSVFILDCEDGEEDEDYPELAEEKLDTDEALERNENVESFVLGLIS